MTRVLHLIKGLGPGGAEALLVAQAEVPVPDLDTEVAYLVPWKDHHVVALEACDWRVRCLDGARIWDPRWMLRLRRLLASGEVDVVHGHSPLVAAISRLMLRTLRRSGRPASVYTEHNEWGRHRRGTRLLNRLTIGLEGHVLAVSDAVARSMAGRGDTEVLIHGIDMAAVAALRDQRDAVRAELGLADDRIVIGIVANHRREKAYDVLIRAVARAVAVRPDLSFVAVGQGPLEDQTRHDAVAAGVADHLLFLGYRPDARRLMAGFDVFTLSSRHEGLPVTLMEAAALELPVVATRVGGVPDAVEAERSILVDPDDPEALADAYVAMAERLDRLPPPAAADRFEVRTTVERLAAIHRDLADRAAPLRSSAS